MNLSVRNVLAVLDVFKNRGGVVLVVEVDDDDTWRIVSMVDLTIFVLVARLVAFLYIGF